MRIFSQVLFTFALIVPCFGFLNSADGAKKIRWQAKAGDQYKAVTTQWLKQELTIQEETRTIENDMKMWMTWTVDDVAEDGTIKMTQVLDRVTVKMKVPDVGDVNFDTSAEGEPVGPAKNVADIVRPMIGAKFVQRMDTRGKIIDVIVPNDALQGLNNSPELKQFFSDNSFKQMMTKVAPVMPEGEIDKGHQWDTASSNKTPVGNMKVATSYVYDGEEDRQGRAVDKFSAKIQLTFEDGAGGPQIEILEQDNGGLLYFDNKAGHIVEASMNQKVTMKVTVGENTVDQNLETKLQLNVNRVEK